MKKQIFRIVIHNDAINDIKETSAYYERKSNGLGKRFSDSVKRSINSLKLNPFFQVRYLDIRCLPLEKFPFMIHFRVDEQNKKVEVYAILNTSLNPDENWLLQ